MGLHCDTRSDGAPIVELSPGTDIEVRELVVKLAARPELDDEDIIEAVCCELYGSDWTQNELIEQAAIGYLEVTERALPALQVAA